MRKPLKYVAPEAMEYVKNYQEEKANKYGKAVIYPSEPKWFISYPYMIAIMAVLQVFTVVFGGDRFIFLGFHVSAGWLILMPIMFYLFQIVAECYGWQYARQIMWCNFIVNTITAVIMYSFKLLPVADFDHSDVVHSYQILLHYQSTASITMLFGMFISDYATSSLMSWSRFQWNGRFILVRMAILHCVAEAIILSGGFIVNPINGYSFAQTLSWSLDSFLARTIIMILLLPFARYVIWYIQNKVEGVIVFDYKRNFNPFKFGINPNDSMQFSATGWKKLDIGKIDIRNFAKAYSEEFFMKQDQDIKDKLIENRKKYGFDKE